MECLSSKVNDVESEKYMSLFSYDMWSLLFVDIKSIDKCMDFFTTGIIIFVDEIYLVGDTIVEVMYRKWLVYILVNIKSIK
jgi:hypothetical protein